MIIRNSQRVPPCSAREPRLPNPNRGSRDKLNQDLREHRLIVPEVQQEIAHDLANKPSARILIETEVNGRVDLYQFIDFRRSFHAGRDTRA